MNISLAITKTARALRWWDGWHWRPPVESCKIRPPNLLKSLAETTDGEVGHER
jgi:hypothetical protein